MFQLHKSAFFPSLFTFASIFVFGFDHTDTSIGGGMAVRAPLSSLLGCKLSTRPVESYRRACNTPRCNNAQPHNKCSAATMAATLCVCGSVSMFLQLLMLQIPILMPQLCPGRRALSLVVDQCLRMVQFFPSSLSIRFLFRKSTAWYGQL